MFYYAHQEHRAVLKKHRAWIYKNAKLYSHTVNVFVELKTVFGLQMSYLLHFWWLHSIFSHFAIGMLIVCSLYAAITIGRYRYLSGVVSKCFIHRSHSKVRSKAVPSSSTDACCCCCGKSICSVSCYEQLYLFLQHLTRSVSCKNRIIWYLVITPVVITWKISC